MSSSENEQLDISRYPSPSVSPLEAQSEDAGTQGCQLLVISVAPWRFGRTVAGWQRHVHSELQQHRAGPEFFINHGVWHRPALGMSAKVRHKPTNRLGSLGCTPILFLGVVGKSYPRRTAEATCQS